MRLWMKLKKMFLSEVKGVMQLSGHVPLAGETENKIPTSKIELKGLI
jgi:hypothetical protein